MTELRLCGLASRVHVAERWRREGATGTAATADPPPPQPGSREPTLTDHQAKPICHAAYENNFNEVQQILQEDIKALNVHDSFGGDTPLICACKKGHIRMATYLLSMNADINLKNNKDRMCLHYAVRRRFTFLDYLLIIILMPVLLLGYLLMLSKSKQNERLIRLLIRHEVDVNVKDFVSIFSHYAQSNVLAASWPKSIENSRVLLQSLH
uniref:Ankyrin repeat domain-containing protein 22 n=1 Tax=Leptobrachium leishanense TaxID=445787 RepID=A0A8C5N1Q1_9ANUR